MRIQHEKRIVVAYAGLRFKSVHVQRNELEQLVKELAESLSSNKHGFW